MVHTHLSEVVLIDMSLTWDQIDIIAPTLLYVERLYLVRNNCSKICTQFKLDKVIWKNLRFLNLEDNKIASWDELSGLRNLEGLTHLIVNKNFIQSIYYKPGFKNLKYLSFEDNLISSWESFDALNEFDSRIQEIRVAGNPLFKIEKNGN